MKIKKERIVYVINILLVFLLAASIIANVYYRNEANKFDEKDIENAMGASKYVGFLTGVCAGSKAEKLGVEITDELIDLCEKSVNVYLKGSVEGEK